MDSTKEEVRVPDRRQHNDHRKIEVRVLGHAARIKTGPDHNDYEGAE